MVFQKSLEFLKLAVCKYDQAGQTIGIKVEGLRATSQPN
jgi:hypothetical protein